jgi:hypothetical protein
VSALWLENHHFTYAFIIIAMSVDDGDSYLHGMGGSD